jgi:hypothetical protein
MKIFSSQKKKNREPLWQYETNGLLWRFILSRQGHIVGETRDLVNRSASFFCLDEMSGQTLWEHATFSEPWWIGIEEIAGDSVYLHYYRKPEQPQHKGIISIDLAGGRRKWEQPDYTYLFASGNAVYAWRELFEGKKFYALDAQSGDLLSDYGSDDSLIKQLQASFNEEDAFAGYRYPEPFDETFEQYSLFAPMVMRHLKAERIVGTPDVLFHNPYVLLSWHQPCEASRQDAPFYDQYFLMLDANEGRQLYQDVIHQKSVHISQDSFFLKGQLVFYVKDARILCAHLLD